MVPQSGQCCLIEHSNEQEQKREHIFLPLLGGGKGGNLNDHEVLRAMVEIMS
jgi:hypothetical protein